MITDNQWADVDGDKDADLVLVGDWMAVTILTTMMGEVGHTRQYGGDFREAGAGGTGWWQEIWMGTGI